MPELPTGTLPPTTGAGPEPEPPVGLSAMSRSHLGRLLVTAREHKLAAAGLVTAIGLTLFSFIGPLVYHTNETGTNLVLANLPPSAAHPLGTTPEGREELGQLMVGGQSTLEVGFAVAILGTAFGMIWGALAGYVGGFIDGALMRIVDALLAIPFLFFIVLLASITEPNLIIIILAITAASWQSTARLVRGEVLSLRTRSYVEVSQHLGARHRHVIFRHLVPNVVGTVVVTATLSMADAILSYAAVAFLGLSVPPPATSWGDLLTTGINNLFDGYWWQLWPPAIAIVLIVLAVNLLGDGIHDMTEHRHEVR